ncbi:hypothetical protein [Bacillus sp. CECT 9360]|uniref:hypothetical protein n=1 Tax=Bacillus sp. CECT 9360 TaxID=2845821 RepID=UPI001E62D325|nr:hypothetical protein [Bacillus sp. CECT 9360]CAH0346413.1 hypothetical protein BCI9360_02747 [Bacillus sp. CECT 9360]
MSKEEFLKKARDMNQDVEYEYKKGTKNTVIVNGTDDDSSGDDTSLNNHNS